MYDFKVGYDSQRDVWVLLNDLYIPLINQYVSNTHIRVVFIERRFETDYASVPRLLWVIFPKSGRWNLAAIVHDWMYVEGFLMEDLGKKKARYLADLQFYKQMRELNVNLVTACLMYWAVRLFGANYYGV